MSTPKFFSLGMIVATPGALTALERNGRNASDLLKRHIANDWGGLCAEDKRANDEALLTGARILSAYTLPDKTKLWIITDAVINEETGERQATTLLLPEEY